MLLDVQNQNFFISSGVSLLVMVLFICYVKSF